MKLSIQYRSYTVTIHDILHRRALTISSGFCLLAVSSLITALCLFLEKLEHDFACCPEKLLVEIDETMRGEMKKKPSLQEARLEDAEEIEEELGRSQLIPSSFDSSLHSNDGYCFLFLLFLMYVQLF